ncbi:MAG: 30S ribosomal protein S13 [Clostridia bacterium]|nr:30S ribosomal protein S13 [Clostridia bacterium]
MARISGVDLPREKRVEIGLTYIYGIGLPTSQKILAETGVNPDTRVKDLTEDDVSKLREYIEHNLVVEGERKTQVSLDIKRLIEIGCYWHLTASSAASSWHSNSAQHSDYMKKHH